MKSTFREAKGTYAFSHLQGRYYALFLAAATPEEAAGLLQASFSDIEAVDVVEDETSDRVYFTIHLGENEVMAAGVRRDSLGYLVGNIHLTGILSR